MSNYPIFKKAFIFFSIWLVIIMVVASSYYGITWDEWVESNNGMLALLNITTFGENKYYLQAAPQYLYSSFFYITVQTLYDIANGALNSFHRLNESQLYHYFNFSHAINSIFGFILMLYTGLFARKIAGWRAACIALFFIAISPRIFGSSMNNPRDIPFAATYVFSLYYMSSFLMNLPKFNFKNILLVITSIGICIGSRTGGVILIFYLFLSSVIIMYGYSRHTKLESISIAKIITVCLCMALSSLHIAFLFWPYGREHSYAEVFKAIFELTQFKYWNYTMLFEGKLITTAEIPWYFIPKWIFISSPFFLHIGLLILFILWVLKPHKKMNNIGVNLIILSALFPLAFVIARESVVYNSWRHLYFIYAPLIILAAIGWNSFFEQRIAKSKKMLGMVILALTCLEPFIWMLRNPIYAGLYFNPLVGGLKGAYLNYESDYWGSCMRESAEWLGRYHKINADSSSVVVLVSGDLMRAYPFLYRALGPQYIPYGYPSNFIHTNPFIVRLFPLDYTQTWDYAIVQSSEIVKQEQANSWPPRGTIFTAQADGIPLCAVVKNSHPTLTR